MRRAKEKRFGFGRIGGSRIGGHGHGHEVFVWERSGAVRPICTVWDDKCSATMTRADCSRAASVCDFSFRVVPWRVVRLFSKRIILFPLHALPAHLPENPIFATLLPTSQARTYDHHRRQVPLVITTTTYRTACVSMYARPFPSGSLSLSLSTRSVVNVCLTSSRSRLARSTVLVLLCSTPESHKLPRSRSRPRAREI